MKNQPISETLSSVNCGLVVEVVVADEVGVGVAVGVAVGVLV